MVKWKWVDRQALLLLHDESLAEHGGPSGLRDKGLLDSALARPLNLAGYGKPDFAELAAAYGFGIARNHPFVDGNKRTSLLASGMFLKLNGYRLQVTQAEVTLTIFSLAAGKLDESGFAAWIREHAAPQARQRKK